MDAFDSSNRVEGKQTVLLRYDVSYAHRAGSHIFTLVSKLVSDLYSSGEIQSQLRRALEPRQIALLHHEIPVKAAPRRNVPGSFVEAVPVDVPPEHTTVFYIGKESLALTNLLMTSSLSNVGILRTLLILLG
jgi:diphthamide biosynthesis protein 2